MNLGLQGKKALVTGSTAGIGLAIALGLAKEGATVIVNGRTAARVDDAVAQIKKAAPEAQVSGLALDLATAKGAKELFEQLPDVDVLVNNLGIFEIKAFEEITDADWLRLFETNVMSGVRLSRFYLSKMKAKHWGRIIFISSESAVNIPVEMIHYGMTKTAQVAVARGLAETTIGTGVTINSILVGPTKSEGAGRFVEQMAKERGTDVATVEKEFFKQARPSSLLQRFMTTEEAANLVVYVCSEAASATNGAALRVEGGLVRSIL